MQAGIWRKTMEHIRELEEQLRSSGPEENSDDISVRHVSADPGKRPAFYRGKDLRGSGICDGGDRRKAFYIGLGSDHTDRELEGMSVPKAKQICAKPIGAILWDYEEIKEHWETIKPYSYQTVDGEEILYQQGTLADIMDPGDDSEGAG